MPASNSTLPIPMTTGTSYKCSCPTSTHRGSCPLSVAIIRLARPQRKSKGTSWVAELTSQLVHRTPKVLSKVRGKGSSGIVRRAGFMGPQKTLVQELSRHECQSLG